MKRAGKPVFFVVAILIFAVTYAAFFGVYNFYGDTKNIYLKGASDIRWGIDIRGGVEAVFSPDKQANDITAKDMDSAKEIIETRLINKNITDSEVYTDYNKNQVIVRFPWQSDEADYDPTKAVAELGETALLTFCEGKTQDKIILKGADDIDSAQPGVDPNGGAYIVSLKLTQAGTAKFAEATARLQKQVISIWMDDIMVSSPTVNNVITNGEAMITGMADSDEATSLANKINAGSLPFALTVDDSKLQIISPTLGAEALNVMLIAGIISFIFVCILMIFKYRLPGIIASIALLGQVAGMIACVSGFFPAFPSFTLTIPGIAGIILSIGMGVDANVITAERIKEEFYRGKTIDGAIDAGYESGWSAILDGNVTVVIVSVVLMGAFGTPDSF
ncbi:MAG: protein translocase subunit SecD, partial [Oscillospiraceae bacterium]